MVDGRMNSFLLELPFIPIGEVTTVSKNDMVCQINAQKVTRLCIRDVSESSSLLGWVFPLG